MISKSPQATNSKQAVNVLPKVQRLELSIKPLRGSRQPFPTPMLHTSTGAGPDKVRDSGVPDERKMK
jgi:hypothetical protein